MSEALKLSSNRANKEDVETAFLGSLEDVSDVIKALKDTVHSVDELADLVNAGQVVPGVLRMIMDKVKNSPKR